MIIKRDIMKVRKCVLIALILIMLFCLPGCFGDPSPDSYEGDYPDLNSATTNSILGVEGEFSSHIAVLEEDPFGRRMYVYRGNSLAADEQVYAGKANCFIGILISQKSDRRYTFFYPDYNFLIYEDPGIEETSSNAVEKGLLEFAQNPAIADDIDLLKQKNDWDNPIDEQKCVKVRISKMNFEFESNLKLVSEKAKQAVYEQVAPQEYFSRGLFLYLTSDDYGRYIYFFRVLEENVEDFLESFYKESYVVMFNKDGTFDPDIGIMEIEDVWDYQDELKAFKERNGWNTPVS